MSEQDQEIDRDEDEVVEAPEAETPEPAPEPTPEELAERAEVEKTARKYGWRPKEEYKNDPKNWVEPDHYLTIPKVRVRVLTDEAKAREKADKERWASVQQTIQQVAASARRQEAERYQAQLAEIQRQQREAVSQGDLETYDRLRDTEARVQRSAPQPDRPVIDQEVSAYYQSAAWLKDPRVVNWAHQAIDTTPGIKSLPQIKQLHWAEAQVRQHWPELFPAPAPAAPRVSRVDGGGIGVGMQPRGPSFDGLPADAKDAFNRFVEAGVFKNDAKGRDAYLKAYLEE